MPRSFARRLGQRAVVTGAILALTAPDLALAEPLEPNDTKTTTPIQHVIVIIGENRTFDHVFGTYQPKPGQSVLNLLSQGIVTAAGKPGPNFGKPTKFGQTVQNAALLMGGADAEGTYTINPGSKTPYATLPPPGAAGTPIIASDTSGPPFAALEFAADYEYGLMPGELPLITTGASALPAIGGLTGFHVPDSRIRDDATLPNGPFWLHGKSGSNGTNTLPYDSYTGNPAHRFYQMWQETDCSVASATAENPSGCLNDLFPWVETTISAGTNGSLPTQYDAQGNVVPYDALTYSNPEGATSMGFYNMAAGDVPYFKQLADQYTISDNNHQGVMGGTGANHIMIGYADMIWYSDGNGHPATPPKGQIEDPNPAPKTNNIYAEDGYGNGAIPGNGGSYSNCADTTQPGVAPITEYLAAIKVPANCQAATADGQGYYYLLNNYNPAYVGNGTLDPTDTGPFTIPATPVRHIGDALNAAEVSWAYYGESWNDYLQDPNQTNNPAGYLYCNICNPFAFSTSTMTNETERKAHLHDTTDLYNDLASGNLPAVSFVKPNTLNDGHPASSKVDLFESFTHKVIAAVKANPELWKTTAILVTFDEGGGYWDSGYIQPVDFFGDGPRIPLIAVSPFAVGGRVVHTYYDHASIPKFIEANWRLKPLTGRSRDNLPNPKHEKAAPYVPTNRPSIGNLMDLFVFPNTSDTPTD